LRDFTVAGEGATNLAKMVLDEEIVDLSLGIHFSPFFHGKTQYFCKGSFNKTIIVREDPHPRKGINCR
jgi:hypothetical protein